jgi:ATP-dependent DNA helicase PIF1
MWYSDVLRTVSMLSAELFDKLEWLGRQIRRNDEPFGGLQVSTELQGCHSSPDHSQIILSGDFFQLPPVSKQGQPEALYAFEAKSWDSVLPAGSLVSLTKVFRQADSHFVDLLDSLRRGTCSNAELAILSRCDRVVQYDDGIEPVSL